MRALHPSKAALSALFWGLAACSSTASKGGGAKVQSHLTVPATTQAHQKQYFDSVLGQATTAELISLQYHISGISICEGMDVSGSGFSNDQNCISLYSGDPSVLAYDPRGSLLAVTEEARHTTAGFVDLMSASSRETMSGTTVLTSKDAHSYSWGSITWAPPVKVNATVPLGDGTVSLYTHDGVTTDTPEPDGFQSYYTVPSTSMLTGPSELAVTVLPNGGNWFKFQSPLVITQADIDNETVWVVDLVFNPDGIVQGVNANLADPNLGIRELDDAGFTARGISIPMLDLAPVAHRQSESAVRESYVAPIVVDGSPFEIRLDIYAVDGDPTRSVYGVGATSLVTTTTTTPPPAMSKISYVAVAPGGTYEFKSWASTPIVTGFTRGSAAGDTTPAFIVCQNQSSATEGGAAILANACPDAAIPVTFTLESIATLTGAIPVAIGGGPDAGQPDGGSLDAGSGH